MTSFTEQIAAELAAETSRILRTQTRAARRKATLIGKEAKLLDVLNRAEEEYNYALELELHRDQQRRLLSAVHRDCDKLRSHLLRVTKTWSRMGQYGGQEEIARFAPVLNTQDDCDAFNLLTQIVPSVRNRRKCHNALLAARWHRARTRDKGVNFDLAIALWQSESDFPTPSPGSPLRVIGGHLANLTDVRSTRRKRTSEPRTDMSALAHYQTYAPQQTTCTVAAITRSPRPQSFA
jgi:hypothetical protein